MDLFRMIFCVFFKDFQRGILFRAIFFYTLSLLSSELSSGLLSLLRSFLGPFISSVPYFLQPLSPVLSSPVFPDSLHLPPFFRLLSLPFLPLSSGSLLYPVSPVISSLLPSTSSPDSLFYLFFRHPRPLSSPGFLGPPLFSRRPHSFLTLTPPALTPPALTLLAYSPPALSLPPPLGGFFIFLRPRLRIQSRPFARPCPPVPLWDHSADRDLSLHVAVSRCRSWTRFRP